MSAEINWAAAIQTSIRNEIAEIIAEEGEAAAQRVRDRVADVAPSIATRLLSHFDISRNERRIVIEIKNMREPAA